MATTSVLLPGEFHGQRRLVGYSPWGRKESDMTEQLSTAYYQISGRIRMWTLVSLTLGSTCYPVILALSLTLSLLEILYSCL